MKIFNLNKALENIVYVFLFLLFISFPLISNAFLVNSLPSDTITVGTFSTSVGTTTLVSDSSSKTILSIGMANDGQSSPSIYCGNFQIARNVKASTGVISVIIPCNSPIYFYNNVNNSQSSVVLNYLPYSVSSISTSTNETSASSTINVDTYDYSLYFEYALLVFSIISFIILFSFFRYIASRFL